MATYKVYEDNSSPVEATKVQLLKKYPWYGALIQQLNIVEKDEKFFEKNGFPDKMIGTDGRAVYINKDEFDKLSLNDRIFMMAQQILRCILFHFSRQGAREPNKWNAAGVIVANGMLVEEEIAKLPKNEPHVPEFKGLSAEEVYLKLQDMSQPQQDKMQSKGKGCVLPRQKGDGSEEGAEGQEGSGDGDGDNEGEGGVNFKEPSNEQLEMNWKIAVENAALQMKKRGISPGNMDRVLDEMRKSKIDWRARIKELLTVPGDRTWARPNRRFIGRGLYLPSEKKSRLGKLVFVIDTSGSINDKMLSAFGGEINDILDAAEEWPEEVRVIWADCQVQGDEVQEGELKLVPKGGGGTAFQPTFDYVENEEIEPQILFYLTDLCGDSPKQPMGYPVVWVVPEQYKDQYGKGGVNWGEMVVIEEV